MKKIKNPKVWIEIAKVTTTIMKKIKNYIISYYYDVIKDPKVWIETAKVTTTIIITTIVILWKILKQ